MDCPPSPSIYIYISITSWPPPPPPPPNPPPFMYQHTTPTTPSPCSSLYPTPPYCSSSGQRSHSHNVPFSLYPLSACYFPSFFECWLCACCKDHCRDDARGPMVQKKRRRSELLCRCLGRRHRGTAPKSLALLILFFAAAAPPVWI